MRNTGGPHYEQGGYSAWSTILGEAVLRRASKRLVVTWWVPYDV